MITISIDINNSKNLLTLAAVRVFPAAPLYPRVNRLALYRCGPLKDGKIDPEMEFHFWYKYGDGTQLMTRVLREYHQIKKHGIQKYHARHYIHNTNMGTDIHVWAGKWHNLDGPIQVTPCPGNETYCIAGNMFSKSEFEKELEKYRIPPKGSNDARMLEVMKEMADMGFPAPLYHQSN